MKNIPLVNDKWTKNKWIDYKGNVLVIKLGKGNSGQFQYDGVSCLQGKVKGSLEHSVKIDSKWFDPEVWYTKTCWGDGYPERIYFDPEGSNLCKGFPTEEQWGKIHEVADKRSYPSKEILDQMISDLNMKTAKNYIFPYDNTNYGIYWWEAYVPLELEGKKYLMTWENCD